MKQDPSRFAFGYYLKKKQDILIDVVVVLIHKKLMTKSA